MRNAAKAATVHTAAVAAANTATLAPSTDDRERTAARVVRINPEEYSLETVMMFYKDAQAAGYKIPVHA